ncbi:MAG: WS/DGAT domain-containing protein, partial [Myxococcales bacterium]
SLFPQVPLLGEMGLGIALMSYDGKICWGFNANPDVIPDLGAFVSFIRSAIDRVAATAGVTVSTSATNIAATKKTARPRKEKLDSQDKGIDVGETVLPGGDRVEPTSA